MGIRHVVLAVNKIDLVDYSQAVFDQIVADFHRLRGTAGLRQPGRDPAFGALWRQCHRQKSGQTPWYTGPSLLAHLESVDVDTALADEPFRLPVQWVNRPNLDFRGFAGTIAGGRIRPGDAVAVAKSGRTSKVARIVTMDGDLRRGGGGRCGDPDPDR